MGDTVRRPIKVMHIIARMNVGGPAVEISELMRGLNPNLVSQRLVTGYCDDDEADFLETQAPDVKAVRLDGLGRSIKPTDDAAVLGRLISMIRASRPDIVHTHTAKAGLLGRVAAKASGTGTKVVHTHHGHLLHGYFGPAKTRMVVEVERGLARSTHLMITVGTQVRNDLLRAGIGKPEQYVVIPPGVRLGPLPDRRTSRQQLGLQDGKVVVVIIGRLTRIKRPDRLVEVIRLTRDKGLDAHFLIAGGGDEEETLRRQIDRHDLPASVLGWRSDIENLLAAADVALLTSDNEGTPLSLIQAAMAHLPAVAPRVGSVPEVVVDGLSGALCDPIATDLAVALEMFIVSPSLRRAMGREAAARALREFSMEEFFARHEAAYLRCYQGLRS